MATKLTVKEELFCQTLIELGNATAAYKKAYDCGKMKAETINSKASLLQKKGKVRARLEKLREDLFERHEATVDKIIHEYGKIIFVDHRKLFNEDGTIKAIHDIDEATLGALGSIEVEEIYTGKGKERTLSGRIKKIKLLDRKGALDSMSRIRGIFQDRVHQTTEEYESMVDRLHREEQEKAAKEKLSQEPKA